MSLATMKAAMLEAAPANRKGELKRLFTEYPLNEMSREYAVRNNCGGITLEDSSVYVCLTSDARWNLHVYLHEIAHAALIRAGHPYGFDHGDDFVRNCRELQMRFGVAEYADHNYDQQDAVIKRPADYTSKAAIAAALAIEYDPTSRAVHAAMSAVQSDSRRIYNVIGIGLLIAGSVFAAIVIDFKAIFTMFNSDLVPLIGGAALAGWIWLSSRG